MTKETARQFIPLVQALADGKTIQVYDANYDKWSDCSAPAFHHPSAYRIKPNPRECWVVFSTDGKIPVAVSHDGDEFTHSVHMREVM